MASVVFLASPTTSHQYGMAILSTDKYTVENFVYNQMKDLCVYEEVEYFQHSMNVKDYGVSYAFIELPFASEDKLLELVEIFNRKYGYTYHGHEMMIGEPEAEFLKELKLL